MRLFLLTASGALLLLPGAPPAAADPAHAFSGTCVLTGELTSADGVGWVPGEVTWEVDVQGHCSGTLDGQPVVALPTRMVEVLRGEREGCLPAGTSRAEGFLDFGKGRRLHFTGTQALVPAAVLHGRVGGSAASVQTAYTFAGGGGSAACTAGEYRRGGFEVRLRADQQLTG